MTRSAQKTGRLTLTGAAWALLLAGCLNATSAAAQTTGNAASAEMAGQKARMLEGFFASYRLRTALGSSPDAVGPLEAEARANLAAGKAALADGRIAEAIELFDAGTRAVSRAIALTSSESHWDAEAASHAFSARRRHAESYLSLLERANDISAADRTKVTDLRARLGEADHQFSNEEVKPALATLDLAYREIVELVSNFRHGHTVVVNKVFETPQEEFEYERQRNQSYNMLVQIALAERGEAQSGLANLAARLAAESATLRDQAEQESASGDVVTAVSTMERATERLLVILRAAGLIMIE